MKYLAFDIAGQQKPQIKSVFMAGFCVLILLLSGCEKSAVKGVEIRLQKGISVLSLPAQKSKKKQFHTHRRKLQQKDSIKAIEDSINLHPTRMVFTFVSYGG